MHQWQQEFCKLNGVFSDLSKLLPPLPEHWPDHQWLNAQLMHPEYRSRLSYISQDAFMASPEIYYEQRVGEFGEIPTRPENWHDFFGAVIWWLFPQTKRTLNQQHMRDITRLGHKKRTPIRDRITHFDECGLVVACTDPELLESLTMQRWQDAFITQRKCWGETCQAFVFGHAIYEIALTPHVGFTGKMYPVLVNEDFFQQPLAAQYAALDKTIASQLQEQDPFAEKGQLTPLPVMGVPHWFIESEDTTFYQNEGYFCPLRRADRCLAPTLRKQLDEQALSTLA